jgi:hypothetical protein
MQPMGADKNRSLTPLCLMEWRLRDYCARRNLRRAFDSTRNSTFGPYCPEPDVPLEPLEPEPDGALEPPLPGPLAVPEALLFIAGWLLGELGDDEEELLLGDGAAGLDEFEVDDDGGMFTVVVLDDGIWPVELVDCGGLLIVTDGVFAAFCVCVPVYTK